MLVVVVLKVLPVPVLIVLRCTGGLVHLYMSTSSIKRLKVEPETSCLFRRRNQEKRVGQLVMLRSLMDGLQI